MRQPMLVRDDYNRQCITFFEDVEPSPSWLAIQTRLPLKEGNWYTAYPLDGGAVSIQVGKFEVIEPVTVKHVKEATFGHSFNPAAEKIFDLWRIRNTRLYLLTSTRDGAIIVPSIERGVTKCIRQSLL